MNIGVDIDGTIKRTQEAAITVFNKELNQTVQPEDVNEFYLDKAFGITPQEGRKLWRKLEHKIYQQGIPLEGAAQFLREREQEGHDIYFITARPGKHHLKAITKSWLKKHGFPFEEECLFMSAQNKAKVARELNVGLFFEDAPQHLENLISAGIPTIVVDAVYNQEVFPDLPRITCWQEAYRYFQEHSHDSSPALQRN